MRTERWLDVAAVVTWVACGLRPAMEMADGTFAGPQAALWTAAFVSYGAALAMCLHRRRRELDPGVRVALGAVLSVAGLAIVHLSGDAITAATLVVAAAVIPYVVAPRTAALWVAAQSVALAAVFWQVAGFVAAIAAGVALGGFQVFALAMSLLIIRERAAREELARANAELNATRDLLAENSRIAERLRIARDLHDTLGHHLTALSLRLDVAARQTSGAGAEHVEEAHAVAKLLLSDVRDVVSRTREVTHVDLSHAVRALAGGAGDVRVHFDLPEPLRLDDPEQAHALVRGVQEIITNAARHASARNLWIRIVPRADGLDLHARDDGRGAAELTWGHGLTGMRERFEAFSGTLDLASGPGRGFEVRAFLPRPGPLS